MADSEAADLTESVVFSLRLFTRLGFGIQECSVVPQGDKTSVLLDVDSEYERGSRQIDLHKPDTQTYPQGILLVKHPRQSAHSLTPAQFYSIHEFFICCT
jgi:hypothetical protein